MAQGSLFAEPHVPPGFEYRADFLTVDGERRLLEQIAALEFSAAEMRGGVARRRTARRGPRI